MFKDYKAVNKQLNQMYRSIVKYGECVKELRREVDELKKMAHPPIFTPKQYNDHDDRIAIIEGFIDNIEKISTELTKDIAN